MDHSEYSAQLHKLEPFTLGNLVPLSRWSRNDALPWLWEELGGVILEPKKKHSKSTKAVSKQKLLPMQPADAVRNGLTTSLEDKKQTTRKYYQAQLTMLDSEALRYCQQIDALSNSLPSPYFFAAAYTLHTALVDLMQFGRILLEDATREVIELSGYYAAWRRRRDHPFEVFKAAEQVIYGVFSGLTHADRAPNTPRAVLRTATELRVRDAFGIYYVMDKNKPEVTRHVDLSKLFDGMQNEERAIKLGVELGDVRKIYSWSNQYLHGGNRDYPWVAGFLLQFLRPFFGGPQHVNDGIKLKPATWHKVRRAVENEFVSKDGLQKFVLPKFDINDAQCVLL